MKLEMYFLIEVNCLVDTFGMIAYRAFPSLESKPTILIVWVGGLLDLIFSLSS